MVIGKIAKCSIFFRRSYQIKRFQHPQPRKQQPDQRRETGRINEYQRYSSMSSIVVNPWQYPSDGPQYVNYWMGCQEIFYNHGSQKMTIVSLVGKKARHLKMLHWMLGNGWHSVLSAIFSKIIHR